MRFTEWHSDREPVLGDVLVQVSYAGADDWDVLRRSYLVVGIKETRNAWHLLCERVEHGTVPESGDPDAMWPFYRMPRNP